MIFRAALAIVQGLAQIPIPLAAWGVMGIIVLVGIRDSDGPG